MLQLIIDIASGVSAQIYWKRFFLGGSALSLFLSVVSAWRSWESQPDMVKRLKALGYSLLNIVIMSLLGVAATWVLAQWWSIPAIGALLLLLWWWY